MIKCFLNGGAYVDLAEFSDTQNIAEIELTNSLKKVNVVLDLENTDKYAIFVFGNENGSPFAALITGSKGSTLTTVNDIVGATTVLTTSLSGDLQTVQISMTSYSSVCCIASSRIDSIYNTN